MDNDQKARADHIGWVLEPTTPNGGPHGWLTHRGLFSPPAHTRTLPVLPIVRTDRLFNLKKQKRPKDLTPPRYRWGSISQSGSNLWGCVLCEKHTRELSPTRTPFGDLSRDTLTLFSFRFRGVGPIEQSRLRVAV